MGDSKLVSIIIPAYNAQDTIKRCVDSCLVQTYSNIEIIVVDDGSTDNTWVIMSELAKSDSRLRIIHSENNGVSVARNMGIDNSKGAYLSFLDADDTIESVAVQNLLEELIENDADIAIGKTSTVRDGNISIVENYDKNYIWDGTDALVELLRDNTATYSVCARIYKRDIIADTRFVPGRKINEDSFFLFQLFLKKPRVAAINQVVYNYYYEEGSAGRSPYSDRILDILYFAKEKKEIIEKDYPEYVDLAYNVIVKANLSFLSFCYIRNAKGVEDIEKECIREVKKHRKYYIPMTRYKDKLFFVVVHNLYFPLKFFFRIKSFLKKIL